MRNQNVLAKLIDDVIDAHAAKDLGEAGERQFYIEFESQISEKMETLRAERRRVYEDVKDIALN